MLNWKTQYKRDVILLKLTYRSNTIPVKISAWFFVTINRIILKFKGERVRINNNNFYKENKVGGSTQFPGLCDYTNQDCMILAEVLTHTHIREYTQSLEEDPHEYVSWSLTKVQKQFNGRKMVFSTSGAEQVDIHKQNKS